MPIIPVIKDITSTDWDGTLRTSAEPEAIWCHVEIGSDGQPGADLFQIGMHNRAWIAANLKNRADLLPPFFQQAMVEMDVFNIDTLRNVIQSVIDSHAPYDDWKAFSRAMSPYLLWEFEGME